MKRFIIICLISFAAGAVSCSKIGSSGTGLPSDPLDIYPSCLGATKAIVDDEKLPGEYSIYMSAYLNDPQRPSNSGDYFRSVRFREDKGRWAADPARYWPLSGTLDFLAIATDPELFPGVSGNLDWDGTNCSKNMFVYVPSPEGEPVEVLYSTASADRHGSVDMQFLHSQACLSFMASCDMDNMLRIKSIEIKDVYTGGLLYISRQGALRATWLLDDEDPSDAEVWTKEDYSFILDDGYKTFSKGIVLPDQDQQDIIIHFQQKSSKSAGWDSKTVEFSYRISPVGSKWRKGKKYTYKIRATIDPITLTPEIVNFWECSEDIYKETL